MLPVWHRAPEAIGLPARLAQGILSKVSREVKAQSAKREQRRALQKESVERNRDGAAYLSSLALMRRNAWRQSYSTPSTTSPITDHGAVNELAHQNLDLQSARTYTNACQIQ